MPAEVPAVVTALQEQLPETVQVWLDETTGRPNAVVVGGGIGETWVDLWTSIHAYSDANASDVAAAIIDAESWPRRA